jgi:hypothetical protein
VTNEDIYAGLGAALSAVFSALSWLWNIPPLQFLFTFVLGSLVTYLIQGKLQDRAEKRKIRREIIEKIYGPLYTELQDIQEILINNAESVYTPQYDFGGEGKSTCWEEIQTYPEYFTIPFQLRQDLDSLFGQAEKIDNSLVDIKKIVGSILIDLGTEVFEAHYRHAGARLSQRMVSLNYFYISYEPKILQRHLGLLIDYTLLDRDPIEDLKERYPDFSPDRCKLQMSVEKDNTDNLTHIEVPINQIQEDLYRLLDIAKERITQEKEVAEFLEERKELSERIDKLLPILEKYIERHYPIENL